MSHYRRVYVVARDVETRRLLTRHVSASGAETWPFPGGVEFLKMIEHLEPGCVLLDLDVGDVAGIDILGELGQRRPCWPVIAMSASDELQPAIEAMKLGAIDFQRLPPDRELLVRALESGWNGLEQKMEACTAQREAQEQLARLTAREIDVSLALLHGGSNKTIAHEFGISVRTVEMHRAHIMAKLGVRSLAEVALLATQAGLDLKRASTAPRPRTNGFGESGHAGSDLRAQLSELAERLSN